MCPKVGDRDVIEKLRNEGPSNEKRPRSSGRKILVFLVLPLVVLSVGIFRQRKVEGHATPSVGIPACVPPAIREFPDDLFTQEQRRSGAVVVHFLATAYLCLVLALVCDQFFVPSLEIIAEALNVPVDVAGATFMAIGTSSPELYSAVIGSFVTKGDIGIGTIVGSAVFNILGVTSVTGLLLWNREALVDWYPISRDCLVYIFSVTTLICILQDNVVTSMESMLLLTLFGVYIAVMYFNSSIKEWGEGTVEDLHRWWKRSRRARASSFGHRRALSLKSTRLVDPRLLLDLQAAASKQTDDSDSDTSSEPDVAPMSPWSTPKEGPLQMALWLVTWPVLVLLTCTIPRAEKGRALFTFVSSVVWIGLLSYSCSWMVTIISHTFGLPDSVAGITILAAGISVPEIIASVIVVRSGMANMALCNLIGSNIFDILFCLGLPWFLRTCLVAPSLPINSAALPYTATALLATVLALFATLAAAGWRLNRGVGLVCAALYAAFLCVACLFELNYFGQMNPPPCPD